MDLKALAAANPDHWSKATAIRALTLDAVAADVLAADDIQVSAVTWATQADIAEQPALALLLGLGGLATAAWLVRQSLTLLTVQLAWVGAIGGQILVMVAAAEATKLPDGGWRATFRVEPDGDRPADMGLFLELRGRRLTETWSYVWSPHDIE